MQARLIALLELLKRHSCKQLGVSYMCKNTIAENFVAHCVPERFSQLASYYYSDAKTIQEMWKVVKQCNRIIDYEEGKRAFTNEQVLTIGIKSIKSFKEFVMKVKLRTKIDNIFGYINGIVNNIMDKLYFDNEFMGYDC